MMIRRLALLALLMLCPAFAYAQATNYCNNQIYQTFEGGTTGQVPTGATLQPSSHGGSAVNWSQGGFGTMSYSSVDMPALVAPGRLCGDSTTYTNSAGSHGLQISFDGNTDFYYVQGNFPANTSQVVVSFEYNEDFAQTDGSTIDAAAIGNTLYGSIIFNAYGQAGNTRYFHMEVTGHDVPQVNWNPSQQCPCKVTLAVGPSSVSTGSSVTLTVLDKNGALIGTRNTTSNVGVNSFTYIRLGDTCNCASPTSGKHSFFDNLQVSFDGSIPGQFCAGASPTWTSSPDEVTLQSCINKLSPGDTLNVLSGTGTIVNTEVSNFSNKVPMSIIGPTLVSNGGTSSPSANDSTPGTSTTIYLNHTSGNGVSLGLAVPRSGCPTPTSTIPCLRLSGLTLMEGTVGPNGSVVILDATSTWPPSSARFRVDNIHQVALSGSATGDMLATQDVYGVFDHIWSQNHSANTIVHIQHFGDAVNKGFSGWNTPLAFGTDQAVYVETSSFQDDFCNTSGAGDGGQGARAVYRHNYELNGHLGFHGTDSGSELSMFSVEQYSNAFVNNACTSTALANLTSRGGTYLHYSDTFSGSASWAADKLQQLRADPSVAAGNDWSTWGYSNGTPWFLNSATLGSTGTQQVTTSGGDWQASHSYTCSQSSPCVIIPTSNNPGNYNYVSFASCTSGSGRPNPFNQAAGTTTPDGSPTCNWVNGWGTTSTGANAQFCALNQDVLVTSLSQCPVGDQVGPLRFFDGPSSAFGYPGRNQIGRSNQGVGTGETLNPDYQWLNTGLPSPGFFAQNDPTGNFIQANRDYYNYQTSNCAGTQSTGVCSGTLANRATNCTPLVAYWAIDTNTLYQCATANTWTVYYTPLAYPHPLVGGGGGGAPIASLCQTGISFNFANVGTVNPFPCTITNTGGGTLTWTSLTSSGAPFSVTAGTCPLSSGSLAANISCNFTITFSPTAQGVFNGTVTLNDNSAGAPHTVSLTGNGVSIAPASQVFALNLSGCKQSAPLVPTWCFTADKHIYVSSCTPSGCSAFAPFTMSVQLPIPGMTATGTAQ